VPIELPDNSLAIMNNGSQIYRLLGLSLGSYDDAEALIHELAETDTEARRKLLSLADSHHVVVRAIEPLSRIARERKNVEMAKWCDAALSQEQTKISDSLKFLADICQKLENAGIQITVMKSLDHWPDIGNDLDLYTPGNQQEVSRTLLQFFEAQIKQRTWGDRLARKCNFSVQGLRKSVEVHHGCLGQTGEHISLANRFYTRRVSHQIADYTFMVPAPEERIIAATLQRMYRHLYIRACDIVNTHSILESGDLDFAELRYAADLGGIWPGVATYLRIVTEFVRKFRGIAYNLNQQILASSQFGIDDIFVRGIWLRVPVRHAIRLYSKQICNMATRRDLHGVLRLSLLPPLASAARLSYLLTGNPSGIW
jgi:hypothetical protein